MPLLSILLQMDELTSAQSSYKRSYVNQSLSGAENGSLFPVPAPLPPSKKQSRGKDKRKSRQWKDTNLYEMESEDFRKEVRITRDTFDFIVKEIKHHLEKGPNDSKRGKPRTKAKDQIAMFLYFVATGCAMRVVGQLFGYGIHTVGDSIRRVSLAIISEFQEDYIKLPDVNDSAQWERIAARFSELAGLCNIGLALDGVYFACNAPGNSGDNIKKEFMNHKGFYSILAMLACDSGHLIRSFYVGWPGSVSDSTAHESSSLGNNIDILLPDHVLVVGDKIFSNSNRMITPIKNETGYPRDHRFKRYNKRHAQTRVIVENTIARLKTRFRVLQTAMGVDQELMSDIAMSCAILHNICEMKNEPLPDEEVEEYLERERELDEENHQAYRDSLEEDGDLDDDDELFFRPIFDLNVNVRAGAFAQREGRTVSTALRTREAMAEWLME